MRSDSPSYAWSAKYSNAPQQLQPLLVNALLSCCKQMHSNLHLPPQGYVKVDMEVHPVSRHMGQKCHLQYASCNETAMRPPQVGDAPKDCAGNRGNTVHSLG